MLPAIVQPCRAACAPLSRTPPPFSSSALPFVIVSPRKAACAPLKRKQRKVPSPATIVSCASSLWERTTKDLSTITSSASVCVPGYSQSVPPLICATPCATVAQGVPGPPSFPSLPVGETYLSCPQAARVLPSRNNAPNVRVLIVFDAFIPHPPCVSSPRLHAGRQSGIQ
jgi:hypothetical protein